MAQQEVKIDPDKLSCSICSELLKDPVTIPCGHSYCKSCISRHWDQEEKTKQNSFSCPMCRKNFSRTGLVKNTVLADLVEELRETQPAAHDCLPGPQDVACDMCTVRKQRASKSCMQCIVSYCEEHLQPHYDVSALKKHKLMEPIKNLQENMCSQHNEVKKIFCRTDQKCICYLCHIDEHKGHDTVSAEAEMSQRQKELEAGQQRVQVLEQDVSLHQQELKNIDESAEKVVSENRTMTDELISVIKRASLNFTVMIRQQKNIEVSRVQALLTKKEIELQTQRVESTRLEQLFHTISYSTQCLSKCPASLQSCELSSSLQERTLHYFDNVSNTLSLEKKRLYKICSHIFRKLKRTVVDVDVLLPQDPKTNEEFSQYSVKLTVDQNTVSTRLTLSEDNRKVTSVRDLQPYLPHPDRFLGKAQALMCNALPARCYWEVQWSGLGVSVGVAYKDIEREGPDSGFGTNNKSWVLDCTTRDCYVYRHKGERRPLSACESFRVGVFLDHKAGILSFYEVSETNKLIHKVQTKFTQPLYAGLGVYFKATAKMCIKKKRS